MSNNSNKTHVSPTDNESHLYLILRALTIYYIYIYSKSQALPQLIHPDEFALQTTDKKGIEISCYMSYDLSVGFHPLWLSQ